MSDAPSPIHTTINGVSYTLSDVAEATGASGSEGISAIAHAESMVANNRERVNFMLIPYKVKLVFSIGSFWLRTAPQRQDRLC